MRYKRLIAFLLMCLLFLSGCNSSLKHMQETWTMEQEKIMSFSDGEYVNLWKSNVSSRDIYKISDETTLLTVQNLSGPANVYVGGVESFDDLNEVAQKSVLAFYEEQGLLYDIEYELEKAYTEYLNCKISKSRFSDFYISQEISPTASNDTLMCFITSVHLPISGQVGQEIRLGAVFSKETGEVYNVWDLFSISEKDAITQLLKISQITDEQLLLEMTKAIKSEHIILFPDNLNISFPQGSLPSQEHSLSIGIEYDELKGLMHSWAIPNPSQT